MDLIIGNLAGLFDGYDFHKGPVTITINDKKIETILFESTEEYNIDGNNHIASVPFVDGHTHLIFGGTRFEELSMKLAGMSYSDILAAGGGITSTVMATRQASDEDLLALVLQRLNEMLSCGTTIVEAKSGYGLQTDEELRLLTILNRANELHPVKVVPTFGGAHVFPSEITQDQYMEMILDEMLPQVKNKALATSTDVFCDKGAFSIEQTVSILERSTELKLPVKVHAEELEYTGIGKLAAEKYDALSADHLLLARADDFAVLEKNNTVAMFMPMAPLSLFTHHKPRGFQRDHLVIGLGSDFNPNNWVTSMQTAIRMAVYSYTLSPVQAFGAATSGSFQGITGTSLSRLQNGSIADIVLLQGTSLEEMVSKFGQNLVKTVIKSGEILFGPKSEAHA